MPQNRRPEKTERSVLDPEPLLPGEHFTPSFADTASPEELAAEIARLRTSAERAAREMPTPAEAMARLGDPLRLPVPDLRAADGSFHAAAIAKALGISEMELGQGVRATRSTLPKTSDAESTHLALIGFALAIAAARVLLPDDTARHDWLHRPQPRLDGRSAMQSMLAGGAWEVALGLEMILDGGGGA